MRLYILYEIVERSDHPIHSFLPASFVPRHSTHCADAKHSRAFEDVRWYTRQFSLFFVPACVKLWNSLTEDVLASGDLGTFICRVNNFLSG